MSADLTADEIAVGFGGRFGGSVWYRCGVDGGDEKQKNGEELHFGGGLREEFRARGEGYERAEGFFGSGWRGKRFACESLM